ncbi:MAG: zinc-binding alcohol dehydrogenase family protein [Burkholderiaceae bacterium]
MKAVALDAPLPVDDPACLRDVELPDPEPGPHDLLVEVRAVSVNPLDTKMRMRSKPKPGQWAVLGWDAAGVVRSVGADVSRFAPGDRVWYAGAIDRQGCNAELHCVDERIVGRMPASLDFPAAAAMPLTGITAWEMLFDRLRVGRGDAEQGRSLLVIGGAGGVGSMMIQLARQLTALDVIATASRPETQRWVRELGAHHVVDHSKPLAAEIRAAGLPAPDYVVSLTHTAQHYPQVTDLIAPQGRFGLIDEPPSGSIDIGLLKRKCASLHWESMFTRSLFATPDMIEQHRLLCELADLVDAGRIRSTMTEDFGRIDAAGLRRAHALLESGRALGKVVLAGFAR